MRPYTTLCIATAALTSAKSHTSSDKEMQLEHRNTHSRDFTVTKSNNNDVEGRHIAGEKTSMEMIISKKVGHGLQEAGGVVEIPKRSHDQNEQDEDTEDTLETEAVKEKKMDARDCSRPGESTATMHLPTILLVVAAALALTSAKDEQNNKPTLYPECWRPRLRFARTNAAVVVVGKVDTEKPEGDNGVDSKPWPDYPDHCY
ncbi:hypothetical protein CC86DRAFT_404941 [Ophiobolus disseminans]|uniref:Uncharacterized protein n=1 Tax=Ophiobolus disseminans TaxID=1469910 RepID=A0A6A7A5F0_9PLEO|nr:hypothetical protein CC86DRAFT_404941 [Ophiobolus disseminans]